MPLSTSTPFLCKAKPFLNKQFTYKFNSVLVVFLSAIMSFSNFANDIESYSADYQVSRKGSVQGNAQRSLSQIDTNTFEMYYSSDIKWMIFSDKRTEYSKFNVKNNQFIPIQYKMSRKGTGPDKEYQLTFDHTNKTIHSKNKKYPLDVKWLKDQQDLLTYQVKLQQEVKAGKTRISYPIIDKKGKQRTYNFKVEGKETITLPVGNIETIKVKRVYDNDKRQAIVWLAPEYDYLVVKIYKGKKGVEQFQVELTDYKKLAKKL
jgi:hypothetical protein